MSSNPPPGFHGGHPLTPGWEAAPLPPFQMGPPPAMGWGGRGPWGFAPRPWMPPSGFHVGGEVPPAPGAGFVHPFHSGPMPPAPGEPTHGLPVDAAPAWPYHWPPPRAGPPPVPVPVPPPAPHTEGTPGVDAEEGVGDDSPRPATSRRLIRWTEMILRQHGGRVIAANLGSALSNSNLDLYRKMKNAGGLLPFLASHPECFVLENDPPFNHVSLATGKHHDDTSTDAPRGAAPDAASTAVPAADGEDAPGQASSRCLHVGNVPSTLIEAQLHAEFSEFGVVEAIKLVSQKGRRFAFVNFLDVGDARAAKAAMSKSKSWRCNVSFAKRETIAVQPRETEESLESRRARWVKSRNFVPSRHLWIGCLFNTNRAKLFETFAKFGAIEEVSFLKDRRCAFVDFTHKEDAVRAFTAMQNQRIGDQIIELGFGRDRPAGMEALLPVGMVEDAVPDGLAPAPTAAAQAMQMAEIAGMYPLVNIAGTISKPDGGMWTADPDVYHASSTVPTGGIDGTALVPSAVDAPPVAASGARSPGTGGPAPAEARRLVRWIEMVIRQHGGRVSGATLGSALSASNPVAYKAIKQRYDGLFPLLSKHLSEHFLLENDPPMNHVTLKDSEHAAVFYRTMKARASQGLSPSGHPVPTPRTPAEVEQDLISIASSILSAAPSPSLKAVELANMIRSRMGTDGMASIREHHGGLLALLERHSAHFRVTRIPKNDCVELVSPVPVEGVTPSPAAAPAPPATTPPKADAPHGIAPSRCLHVANIPATITEAALRDICVGFGVVEQVRLVNQKGRRFAFVNFTTVADAANAKAGLSGLPRFQSNVSFAKRETKSLTSPATAGRRLPTPIAAPPAVHRAPGAVPWRHGDAVVGKPLLGVSSDAGEVLSPPRQLGFGQLPGMPSAAFGDLPFLSPINTGPPGSLPPPPAPGGPVWPEAPLPAPLSPPAVHRGGLATDALLPTGSTGLPAADMHELESYL